MTFIVNIEINILSLVILFVLFISMFRRSEDMFPDQKLFLAMLVSVALLLIFDTIQWAVDGRSGTFLRVLNIVSGLFYYLTHVLPCMFWCLYVRYQFIMDENETMKVRFFLHVPVVINAVLAAFSCFNGMYFYVDAENVYHRGEFFWLFSVIIFGYFLYALIYIILHRKKIEKLIFYSLLIFPLAPFFCGIIQVFYYGMSLILPCMVISLLIIFVYIQNNQLYTDHLTGLYNRRRLDTYLGSLKKGERCGKIGSIMLDIDGFKSINDQYGHSTGDRALVSVASILKKSLGKEGFLARYGGDEFVIIIKVEDISGIEHMVEKIKENFEIYIKKNNLPYRISVSMGYDIFGCGEGFSEEYVLNRIDRLMYENKQKRRNVEKQLTIE